MPKLDANRVPSYRLHRQSGQGIVTLNGRDFLLGKHDTKASREKYNQLISRWIAAGRYSTPKTEDSGNDTGLTVSELIARYKVHVEAYYRRPDGKPTGEADNIRHAVKPLRMLFGNTPAAAFSPLDLKAVREAMINPKLIDPAATGNGWCRRLVNQNVFRIINMFRWAAENVLVDGSVVVNLQTVASLKLGRTEARESAPIMPVDDATMEATIPHLTTVVDGLNGDGLNGT